LYDSDSKAGTVRTTRQRKKRQKTTPSSYGAKSQYCATKRAVFMESCLSPLSTLGSKIRVHFQNKIPFQRTKTIVVVSKALCSGEFCCFLLV
jgi:hypothetical protein